MTNDRKALSDPDEPLILAIQNTAQRWRQSGPAIDVERVDKTAALSVWRWLSVDDQQALADLMREQDAVAIGPPTNVVAFPATLVVARPAIGAPPMTVARFEIIKFTKSNGPLTKRISLSGDGVKSDGSACTMSRGTAQRIRLTDTHGLAELIGRLQSDEAVTLGVLRPGLPDQVKVITKTMLKAYGGARHAVIARTGNDIDYRKGQLALALLDFDTKGMPSAVAAEMERLGGFWPALLSVLPALEDTARVTRSSTSAGLYRADTGERLRGSSGRHDYVVVQDGADIERFLKTLHQRCWLAGLGWMMVGVSGQLLERSIVDRMVGSPERLVFEGAPILDPPLAQDCESRRPIAVDGEALNTVANCPPLTIAENVKLLELKAKEAYRLEPEVARERAAFIERQATHLSKRAGISKHAAEKIVTQQCEGVLLPDLMLPFDDEQLDGCTVADVLADPDRFEGETLADPLEGVSYGRCCAKIMRRADGTPWIHSFAHGRTI
jgi:hypothetical protein